MDRLDVAIERKRRQVEELEQQLSIAKIQLSALSEAAGCVERLADQIRSMRPGALQTIEAGPRKHKGRAFGSISTKWRKTLEDMAKFGNPPHTVENIRIMAERHELHIADSSVRERMRIYAEPARGFVEEIDGKFRVREAAITSLGLNLETKKDPASIEIARSLNGGPMSSDLGRGLQIATV